MSITTADGFDDFKRRMKADGHPIKMQPIELTPGRYPLPKAYPATWSIERQIVEMVKEGNALLTAEAASNAPSKKDSVNPDPKTAVQDALAATSSNPYIKARAKVLSDMLPSLRAVIEKMEAGTVPKDARYDQFCLKVAEIGDKLSSSK